MQTFDPFGVLGLPRVYEVDAAAVERAYLERSADMHPDLMSQHAMADMGGEPDERVSELNRAREVVGDPEKRAVALWMLLGGVESKELPPGFLMEMMEVREAIEAARAAGDRASLGKWAAWAAEQRGEYQKRVAGLFAAAGTGGSGGGGGVATLKQIKLELNAWRYVERLVEQM